MTDAPLTGTEVDVPEEWRRIGFSGLFHVDAEITPDDVDLWRGRVPCMIAPFGGNTGWLALTVHDDPPRVTIVRKDENAIVDVATGRLGRTADPPSNVVDLADRRPARRIDPAS